MNQKNVLITGCSSGVGLHSAIQLAKEGFKVYATLRDVNKSSLISDLAKQNSVDVTILPLDVQKQETIDQAVESILNKDGKIDILVNNAGFGFIRSLEQASMQEIQNVMDVNYFGVIRCIKSVLPAMREKKSGHILTITSVGGLIGQPMNEVYCSAKFALEGLIESMATYLEPFFGVKMSIIEPGAINTEFVNRVMSDVQKTGGIKEDDYLPVMNAYRESARKSFTGGQTPEEVAAVIVKCIQEERPHLRYQTSDKARIFSQAKLGQDPTGDIQQKQIRKLQLGIE